MEFCPECGSIISPETDDDGNTVLDCSNCDYADVSDESVSMSEQSSSQDGVTVVDDEDEGTKPEVDKDCPECGNDTAKYWTQQTRAGDEPATRFYECTDCGHKWREY